ncbi:DUF4279 domain-containing protein [Teredinibacter turnerae]|uniref:DUF4279 domain-containing protein n=1 Tax=Teredinibacter turnerae TaxID=2426 RepID=UPI0003666F94|nr:DUF4279 domain-containing protein [Teredinibacter turnerae]
MSENENYINKAIQELANPEFEVTKQYLQVMELELEDGIPKVARVNLDHADNSVAVYFFVKDERFFIAVTLSRGGAPSVQWVWIESGHRVYLTATSETLTYDELSRQIPFEPLSGWSVGDVKPNGKASYDFTRVSYEPIKNEAYGLEEKLHELLKVIESESESIRKLGEKAESCVAVCKHQYISANAGVHMDVELLNSLSAMGLALDIDTYIVGNEIE